MGSMVLCTLTHLGIIPNGFSNEFAHYFDFEESDYWRTHPAVSIDTTFTPTRRAGSVSQEAYHTLLGLLPDGTQEVLCVEIRLREGALNWELELNAHKERGEEQIDLIISDALQGIERAVCSAFPQAARQFCVVHFKRHVLSQVAKKDKALLKQELDELFSIQEKGLSHHSMLLEIYVHLLNVGVCIIGVYTPSMLLVTSPISPI